MEEIKFEELIDICASFLDDPENKENVENFNNIKRKLVIKTRMPIDLKEIFIDKALFEAKLRDEQATTFAVGMEVFLMFDCLLAYTNIEQKIKFEYKNYEIYNLILDSGLYDYIYGFCAKDYDNLRDIAYRAFSYENLIKLVEVISAVDTENVKDLTNEIIDFKQNKKYADIISDIKEITRFNDPVIAKLSDSLKEIEK